MFAVCPVGVVNEDTAHHASNDEFAEWRPLTCPSDAHKQIIDSIQQQKKLLARTFAADSTRRMTELFNDDKLFLAHKEGVFALQCLHLCKEDKLWQTLANSAMWNEIVVRVHETKELLREFATNDGWSLVRSDRFETRYREEAGKNTHSFRVSGVVECEVMKLVAVLYEIDLFPSWFPFCKFGKELLSLSRFHKLVHMEIFAPWPVANRDLVCDAYGVNLLESHQVVIFLRSIHAHNSVRLPKPNGSAVRALIHLGGFLIEPISRSQTRTSLLINTDPKFDQIPTAVLNFITGRLVHVILSQMEKAAKFNDTSPYHARLKEHAEVYDFVRAAADDFFEQQAPPQEDTTREQ